MTGPITNIVYYGIIVFAMFHTPSSITPQIFLNHDTFRSNHTMDPFFHGARNLVIVHARHTPRNLKKDAINNLLLSKISSMSNLRELTLRFEENCSMLKKRIKVYQEVTEGLQTVCIEGPGAFNLPKGSPRLRLTHFIKQAQPLLILFPNYNPFATPPLTSPQLRSNLTDEQLLSLKFKQEPFDLDFSGMSQISARGMVELLHGFSSVRVNYEGCDRMLQDMQDDPLLSMDDILALEKLRKGYSPLLSSPDYIKIRSRMKDEHLITLFQNGKIDPNTRKLDLENMPLLTAKGFHFILAKLLKIDRLTLGNANLDLYLQCPQPHLRVLRIPIEVSQSPLFP